MTFKRAIEVLRENEFKIVEIGRNAFVITYDDGDSDIVGEQTIINLAREIEER
jgi:hypothetical protein